MITRTLPANRGQDNGGVLLDRRLRGAGPLTWASQCNSERPDRVLSRLTLQIRRSETPSGTKPPGVFAFLIRRSCGPVGEGQARPEERATNLRSKQQEFFAFHVDVIIV